MVRRSSNKRERHATGAPVKLTDNGYRRYSRKLVISLIGISLAVGIGVLCSFLMPNQKAHEDRLRVELARQVAEADYDAAMESLQALQQISPDSSQIVLQRAVIERARGHHDAAATLITQLIERRNPEAALWELERIVDRPAAEWNEKVQSCFEEFVAMASASKNVETRVRARRHWATNRLRLGELNEALVTLEELAKEDPASSLHAASIASQLGLKEQTRRLASNSKQYFVSRIHQHPEDDQCRLSLARTLLLLEQEPEAVRLLSEGFELTRQPKFQQAAGEAMIAWANRLKAASNTSLSAFPRLQLVHRATQCAPSDQAVLSGVVSLVVEFNEHIDQVKLGLREHIALGRDSESGHFMLGLLTLLENDTVEAKIHFDLAEKAGSHVATVLNNLALRAQTDSRLSIEQALMLAGEAVRRMPAEPRFRETRSRFLMQQKRYEAAIEDLLLAAEVAELKPLVEENLALAYEGLNAANTAR